MGIVLTQEEMKLMNLFEILNNIKAIDCLVKDDMVIFVVDQKEVGKAIGKAGKKIKNLERILKKRVRIVSYYENPLDFVKAWLPGEVQLKQNPKSLEVRSKVIVKRETKELVKELLHRLYKISEFRIRYE